MIGSMAKKDTLCAEDLKRQVKSWFGGMGSLNDIVVFRADGAVDRDASDEFDKLRSELYNLVNLRMK
jgi:hypothetical protein